MPGSGRRNRRKNLGPPGPLATSRAFSFSSALYLHVIYQFLKSFLQFSEREEDIAYIISKRYLMREKKIVGSVVGKK